MKVTVVPLDSRPCNHSWVKKYAQLAGVDISIIDYQNSGNLHKGLNTDGYEEWLLLNCKDSDALLVSIDAISSGGLIQARQGLFSLDKAIHHIDLLKKVKHNYPDIKIYAFDTIMRTSITTYDEETSKYWNYINEYSRLCGENHFEPSMVKQKRIKELEAIIPNKVLNAYLLARKKKHFVNNYMVNLTNNNIIECLLLLQEDSMPSGLQKIENITLSNLVDELNLNNKVSIYNGTDEGTVVLLAKWLNENISKETTLSFMFPDEDLKHKIMPFEDREIYENCKHLMKVIGFKETNIKSADYIIAIYTEETNYDLDLNTTKYIPISKESKYIEFVNEVNELISSGKKVALVDLLHPNGGSKELLKIVDYNNLIAYSAWNTASNSLGSCLALIGVHTFNNNADLDNNLMERIIDDCLYQTIVRRKVNESLLEKNINIYDLGNNGEAALKEVNNLLKDEVKEFFGNEFSINFPWNRTFEIDIDME